MLTHQLAGMTTLSFNVPASNFIQKKKKKTPKQNKADKHFKSHTASESMIYTKNHSRLSFQKKVNYSFLSAPQ